MHRDFRFYSVDVSNSSYNPKGSTEKFRFPHGAESFDLIVATSVFTHLLPVGLENDLAEAARMLAPGGVLYASFLLRNNATQNEGRHAPMGRRISCS
jgi:SAM-dependent methyltransferase